MATLMDPIDVRFRAVEERLASIEHDITDIRVDIGAIKARLDALPTRWMFIAFAASLLFPLYGLALGLLYFVLNTPAR